jgi:general secretion pathway protein D
VRHKCLAAILRLAALALFLCPLVVYSAEPTARQLYKQGRKFEKQKDFAGAYLRYAAAAAKDPTKREYWIRAEALRTRAATAAKVMPVFADGPNSLGEPEPLPRATPKEVEDARKPQPPFELRAMGVRRDFNLRADAHALWEQVAKQYGLDVIFDGDYQAGPVIRFRITEAGYREAIYTLMTVTGSFIVPISDRVFMVVKDTEQKRREVENHIAVTVPIPEPVTVQEAQELGRAVQQLMEIQRFSIDSAQRLVIFRDRASKVRPAQAVLEQMLQHKPEIALEVELISVAKTTSLEFGLSLPTDFPLVSFADLGRHGRFIPSGFLNFLTFGGANTYLGIGLTSAQLLATWSKSVGQSILCAEIRTLDGQAVNFHAGDKYPIMTQGYFGRVQPGAQVYTPPPTFNFEDLGLVLKITPKVHNTKEVTLEVEAEFKVLGTTSFNGIPVIGNRKFANQVRLNFDQSAVIAGLVNDTSTRSLSGLAGVANVPALGALLSRTKREKDQGEILLSIKPRLLSMPPSETVPRPIFIGAESRLLTPM